MLDNLVKFKKRVERLVRNRRVFLLSLLVGVIVPLGLVYFDPFSAPLPLPYEEDHNQTIAFLNEVSSPKPEVSSPKPKVIQVETRFAANSTLAELLGGYGVSPEEIYRLIQDTKLVYNLNHVRAGNPITLEWWSDGSFRSLQYGINPDEYVLIERDAFGYKGVRRRYDFQIVVSELYGEINDSLWASLISLGEKDGLVVALADILQWDVDFTTIQPGDSFKVIVEKKYLDNRFIQYGSLVALEFKTSGKSLYCFLFEDPETKKRQHYDQKGNAVRKAFLRVPFNFNPRVTSNFSYSRYHPILKRRRPHLGVDYGAPTGTPVLASASGRVIFAGRQGGYGKLVKIRHPSGYVTGYAHLSRIHVRVGQKVIQGQRVGRVGATGLATGSHLDYRIYDKRGKPINPRKLLALPSDRPVEQRYREQFLVLRDAYMRRLQSIQEVNLL